MASRVPGSFRLFRAFGIDVFLHWSWFLVALVQYQLAVGNGNGMFTHPMWHAAVYLSLFGIVTLHEFGHALACKSVGGHADTIVLWPLGGVAFVQPPPRPGATLWSIAAGPLVNVLLVPVTLTAWMAVGAMGAGVPSDFQHFVLSLTAINLLLLVFNMLPIYPLDGGQVLQSLLWFVLGRVRSLKVAASFGLVFAVVGALAVLVFNPPFLDPMWTLIIAAFIGWQAWRGLQYANRLGQAEAQWRTGQLPGEGLTGRGDQTSRHPARRDEW